MDIGANIGLISIPLALTLRQTEKAFPSVVAIEAVPDNFAILQRNIQKNDAIDRIHAMCVALGDANKHADIQVEGNLSSGEGSGTANILPEESTYDCVRQQLHLHRLDELLDNGIIQGVTSVVKIDTDGFDLKILMGASKLLKESRPVIFGEFDAHCLNWHGQTIRDVVSFAEENDYSVWLKKPKEWKFVRPQDLSEYKQDALLVPCEKINDFGWCLLH